ncbi:branched-chain amino acid ABC transporter permease [Paracoccus ravus]|uniref:branched-chain amino acid ABC transporter permease n=1 Tax=Paracoccus ravus TaxID=2447760 RepID=UPI00106DE1BD|nr:branched-chain amino acid ABC transporter permease [Paracoccus ravus]
MLSSTLILGLVLGGSYALVAVGMTLQYGIARIMNLAYGEFIILAAFATYLLFGSLGISPIVALLIIPVIAFGLGVALFQVMMRPLVTRAGGSGRLEVDSILATFGLLFVLQGVMLLAFGGNYTSYGFLDQGVNVLGTTLAANRLLAFALSIGLAGGLFALLQFSRWGLALRAVALAPGSAALVGLNMRRIAALGFGLGTALAAAGGVTVSMFQTFSAHDGVLFTMKALVIVIMGGVGNVLGALVSGLLLGLMETAVARWVDPGLTLAATYILFLAVLLWRPEGLFGKAAGR